jgi:hypothetical protein
MGKLQGKVNVFQPQRIISPLDARTLASAISPVPRRSFVIEQNVAGSEIDRATPRRVRKIAYQHPI